jgi:hypothetical protein
MAFVTASTALVCQSSEASQPLARLRSRQASRSVVAFVVVCLVGLGWPGWLKDPPLVDAGGAVLGIDDGKAVPA